MNRDVPDAELAPMLARVVTPDAPPPPDVVALCGLTADDFHDLLLDLLPVGAAWPRLPGTILWEFWFVPADTYAAVQASDCRLLGESYPCTATELLPEWEATVGLPDPCVVEGWPPPLAMRQHLVCLKLAMVGGQSPAYFIALAAAYGFEITITEHKSWRLGLDAIGCTPPLGRCAFWWEVNATNVSTFHARMGCWILGQPLCWRPGAAELECIIRRAAPAHTVVTFNYPDAAAAAEEGTRHVHAA